MSVNPIKAWLEKNNAMGDVMQDRVQESAELKERYDLLMNAVCAESEIQKYIEGHLNETAEAVTRKINELLYETAQKKGISLYQLCASVVPEIKQSIKPSESPYPFKLEVETEISLIPKNHL